MSRGYTEQERADAVGRALAVGAKKAAAELGIPRRTLSSWLHRPSPGVQAAIVSSEKDVAARLWEAVDAGTTAVLEGLRDPKARLGDKANALRIVVEAHALLTGGATARTENLNLNAEVGISDADRAIALEWLDTIQDASDEELAEWAANGGLVHIRDHWTPRGVAKQQFLREQGEGDDA